MTIERSLLNRTRWFQVYHSFAPFSCCDLVHGFLYNCTNSCWHCPSVRAVLKHPLRMPAICIASWSGQTFMTIAYHVSITCFPWLHCSPEHGESGSCVATPSRPRTPYSLTEEVPYFPLRQLAQSTNNNKNDGDDNDSNININDIMITV